MKRVVRNVCLVISALSACYLINGFLEETASLSLLIIFPIFIAASIIAIFIPTDCSIKYLHKYLTSFAIWIVTLFAVSLIMYSYFKIKNNSKVIYSVTYYWEEGIQIDFRDDNSFKVFNSDVVSNSVSYGDYVLHDSLIVLQNEVYWGMSKLSDTLTITEKGIDFKLDKPWRNISEATLTFQDL